MVTQAAAVERGRQAEARRNDVRILQTALGVFAADPDAPMSAVARAAGVGQATLYRRYRAKDDLVVAVCAHGLGEIAHAASEAVGADEPWPALVGFLDWYTSSGALRMTALLGTFTPPAELLELAHQANLDMATLVRRAQESGVLRSDVTGADLTLLAEWLGSIGADGERGGQLRRRYLELVLQSMSRTDASALPGPAPTGAELEAPWLAHADS